MELIDIDHKNQLKKAKEEPIENLLQLPTESTSDTKRSKQLAMDDRNRRLNDLRKMGVVLPESVNMTRQFQYAKVVPIGNGGMTVKLCNERPAE
jgi:hypothetical protein